MKRVENSEIIRACSEEQSMARAASRVGLHFNTFARRAKELGVYNPNPSGKGLEKPKTTGKIPLKEILDGLHPYYQTNKLRKRLFKESIKDEKCEVCGVSEWNGMKLSFELDHQDGNRSNHRLENIRILCPNCHSQTSNYRGRNI